MRQQSCNIPVNHAIAYFLTWTTYGTWLPGDERGWVKRPGEFMEFNPNLEASAKELLTETPASLDCDQRKCVEETIKKHCQIRGWTLHGVNCRTQHVHVVVTGDVHPKQMIAQFKSWSTRCLKEMNCNPGREKWWTEGGSQRWINDEDGLLQAIQYVRDFQ